MNSLFWEAHIANFKVLEENIRIVHASTNFHLASQKSSILNDKSISINQFNVLNFLIPYHTVQNKSSVTPTYTLSSKSDFKTKIS